MLALTLAVILTPLALLAVLALVVAVLDRRLATSVRDFDHPLTDDQLRDELERVSHD